MKILEEDLASANGPVLQSSLHYYLCAVLWGGLNVCSHRVAHDLVSDRCVCGGGDDREERWDTEAKKEMTVTVSQHWFQFATQFCTSLYNAIKDQIRMDFCNILNGYTYIHTYMHTHLLINCSNVILWEKPCVHTGKKGNCWPVTLCVPHARQGWSKTMLVWLHRQSAD